MISFQVNFQLGYNEISCTYRAVNIINKKELLRGVVERIKDQVNQAIVSNNILLIIIYSQFGFINYKYDNGDTVSVFFHKNSMSGNGGCV